jgi:hypothetical protein
VWPSSVFPSKNRQNCFGLESPAIWWVISFNLVPSPPASTTAHVCFPLEVEVMITPGNTVQLDCRDEYGEMTPLFRH